MEAKPDDGEEDGENDEPANLNRLTTDGVRCSDGNPVAGNKTRTRQNKVPNPIVVESTRQLMIE